MQLMKSQLATTGEADAGPADPETLLRNIFLACSDEHDWSKMECFHLINNHPYVKFSRQHVTLNLSQTRQIRLSSSHEGGGEEQASRENHYDVYIRRDTDPNYIQLLAKYESGALRLPKSPANVCLYEFAAEYGMDWTYQPTIRVPQATPLYKFVPPLYRGENLEMNPYHLDYCRTRYLERNSPIYTRNFIHLNIILPGCCCSSQEQHLTVSWMRSTPTIMRPCLPTLRMKTASVPLGLEMSFSNLSISSRV